MFFVCVQGVITAVPLAYVLPAVTYLKLDPGRTLAWNKLPAFLLAFSGGMAAICGTVFALINVLDGISCSHGSEMPYCADANIYKFMERANNGTSLLLNSSSVLLSTSSPFSFHEP